MASRSLYGGTFTQFDVTLRRLGIEVRFADFDDESAVRAAIGPGTRLLYGETIGNPRADVLDQGEVNGHPDQGQGIGQQDHGTQPLAGAFPLVVPQTRRHSGLRLLQPG